MIQKARFQNFKSLRDVEITFDSRLTVLVGPNGSGKTSVLNGLHYASQFALGKPVEKVLAGRFHPDNQVSRAPDGSTAGDVPELVIDTRLVEHAKVCWQFEVCIRHGQTGAVPSRPPFPRGAWSGFTRHRLLTAGRETEWVAHANKLDIPAGIRSYGSSQFLRLDANVIGAPSVPSLPLRVGPSGENVPSMLVRQSSTNHAWLAEMTDHLRAVIPSVRAIQFRKARVRPDPRSGLDPQQRYEADVLLYDFADADRVPAAMVSEGTLLVTGLLTALMTTTKPRLLLLDDLDRALHPQAQGELVAAVQRLVERFPDLQVVATSHSPYVLDRLSPEQVRLVTYRDGGGAVVGKLSEHPDFERWKVRMSPGEFWTHVGEDWLRKQRPAGV